MALAINSQMPTAVGKSSATSPLTYSFTNTAGTYLLVSVISALCTAPAISSVTYAGAGMSLVKTVSTSGGAIVSIYGLLSPATGSNNVVVTLASSNKIISGAISFTGNDPTNPTRATTFSATGSSTTISVAVTGSTTGNIIFDTACNGTSVGTSTQTLSWKLNAGSADCGNNGGGSTASGNGGSVTMSYTSSGNDQWAIAAVEVVAAVASVLGWPSTTVGPSWAI